MEKMAVTANDSSETQKTVVLLAESPFLVWGTLRPNYSGPLRHMHFVVLFATIPMAFGLSLPVCTDPGQAYQGYTYTVDQVTGKKVWSHCEFPDPRYDHALCGQQTSTQTSFICDPDNLIASQQSVDAVNKRLRAIQNTTSRQCYDNNGKRQGFIVAVVLVDVIRVGVAFQSNSCLNDCGEIYPTLNTSVRQPTTAELDVTMETFADGLRKDLQLGSCDNDVIVFYSKSYKRVHISFGSRVGHVVDSSTARDLAERFLDHITQDSLERALMDLAEYLRTKLRGLTPAHIMLIITLVFAALLLLFLLFFIHLSDTDYSQWGHEKGWAVVDVVVELVTGVLLISLIFRTMTLVSERVPLLPVIILLVMGVACTVVLIITEILHLETMDGELNLGTPIRRMELRLFRDLLHELRKPLRHEKHFIARDLLHELRKPLRHYVMRNTAFVGFLVVVVFFTWFFLVTFT